MGRTVLGGVHRLAREERCPPRFDPGRACEIDKQPECRFVYAVLREIEQEAVAFDVKALEPVWVVAKEIRDCLPGHGLLVRFQRGQSLSGFITSHASPQVIIGPSEPFQNEQNNVSNGRPNLPDKDRPCDVAAGAARPAEPNHGPLQAAHGFHCIFVFLEAGLPGA
jgi:hypothetical protein